jgi:hypothetical protein
MSGHKPKGRRVPPAAPARQDAMNPEGGARTLLARLHPATLQNIRSLLAVANEQKGRGLLQVVIDGTAGMHSSGIASMDFVTEAEMLEESGLERLQSQEVYQAVRAYDPAVEGVLLVLEADRRQEQPVMWFEVVTYDPDGTPTTRGAHEVREVREASAATADMPEYLPGAADAVKAVLLLSIGEHLIEMAKRSYRQVGRGAIMAALASERLDSLEEPWYMALTSDLAADLIAAPGGPELLEMLQSYDPDTEFVLMLSAPVSAEGTNISSVFAVAFTEVAAIKANPGRFYDINDATRRPPVA